MPSISIHINHIKRFEPLPKHDGVYIEFDVGDLGDAPPGICIPPGWNIVFPERGDDMLKIER